MIILPFKFRDVIHDFIEFPNNDVGKLAISLMQTRAFQRLRNLSQLGMAKYIYPCAEHSRYSHSLGAFFLCQRVLNILKEKNKLQDISEIDLLATCLTALLHDIGHGVFSHASEIMWNFKHEEQTCKLIEKDTEISEILKKYSPSFSLGERIISILTGENLDNNKFFLHEIISSQLDVDRMDYILRDSHMTGVYYGNFDLNWILNHLNTAEFHGKQRLVIESKATHAVEQYLTARFYMYRNVYEHKTARIFEVMLQAIVSEAKKLDEELLKKHNFYWLKMPNFDDLEHFKLLDDYKMWEAIKTIAYSDDFQGHIKELSLDFLSDQRWEIEKKPISSNKSGFFNGLYYAKMKPSKFYDPESDKQILVLVKNSEEPKLLSELGKFVSINKKTEQDELFVIKRRK